MPTINPYLTFNGNCEAAFLFYQSVFGGEFSYISRFKDMPSDKTLSDAEGQLIMHVSLPLDRDFVLMGSDTLPSAAAIVGNNVALSLNANSEAEADNLFSALAAGGNITMQMTKTFWGAYFGMFTDKFGINWMVNYDYPTQKE